MQAFARAPNKMSNNGPMDKNWKIFKEQFLTFMKVTEGNLEASDKQAIMLLNLMGEVGQEALQNIPFEYPEEKENIEILLDKFDKYFDPPKRETNERYIFFTRTRKQNESIDDFVAALREKAKTCNFGSVADSLIRDKVILDTKDKILRKILIDTDDLDLTKVVTIYKSHEMATEKIKQVYKEKTKQAQDTNVKPTTTNTEVDNKTISCSRCGTHHVYRNCPAWGKKCGKCQGLGHYTHKCTPHLAQKSYKCNKEPNKNVTSPFTQIDKKNKTGKTRNNFRTSSNQQDTNSTVDQIPSLMAPPAYTPYSTPTEAYNPGYMQSLLSPPAYNAQGNGARNCSNAFVTQKSVTEKVPLNTCSMQHASSSYSGRGSAPPLDSKNVSVTSSAQTHGSLYPILSNTKSSSDVKSTTPRRAMQFNDIEVIEVISAAEEFVVTELESNSSQRKPNRPAYQSAQSNARIPRRSSSSSTSKTKNQQSKKSPDNCIIC